MTDTEDRFQLIREFYDGEYHAQAIATSRLSWHCRRVASRFGALNGQRVLDVACGTGQWLEFFQRAGAEIAGIDVSSNAIAACRQRLPHGNFHCGPAEALPFATGYYDLVTCMGSLEHFLDKSGALKEMMRVARPDARFVILVPSADFLTRRLGLYRGTEQARVKEDVKSLAGWDQLFRDAGLQVTDRWRDLHTLSRSWICRGRTWAWPVRTAQAMALAMWPIQWQYQVYHYCKKASG